MAAEQVFTPHLTVDITLFAACGHLGEVTEMPHDVQWAQRALALWHLAIGCGVLGNECRDGGGKVGGELLHGLCFGALVFTCFAISSKNMCLLYFLLRPLTSATMSWPHVWQQPSSGACRWRYEMASRSLVGNAISFSSRSWRGTLGSWSIHNCWSSLTFAYGRAEGSKEGSSSSESGSPDLGDDNSKGVLSLWSRHTTRLR